MFEKLLVIDNDDSISLMLKEVLRKEGFLIEVANNISEVLEKTGKENWDLVVASLDPSDEYELSKLMAMKGKYPGVKQMVVFQKRDTGAFSGFYGGIDYYIARPTSADEFLYGFHRELKNYRLEKENKLLKLENNKLIDKLRISYIYSMHSLVIALEEKDPYTAGHSERVAQYSVEIARRLGLSEYTIDSIALAGLLHDIGKIGIKEVVLHKPGNLSDEEYEHIKKHPQIGKKILEPMLDQPEILDTVLYHHERYDGGGYPEGLRGYNIPLEAKILSIADAFDAMTSNRPYRAAMKKETAVQIVSENSGKQFDPVVVDAFLGIC